MNYSPFLLLSSLFFSFSVLAIGHQELLTEWKALAENEHVKVNDYFKKPFKSKKDIDINYLFGDWYNEETYNQDQKNWLAREHIDHIKIIYNGLDGGRPCKVYLQLEDSVLHVKVTGLIGKLIFRPRYFIYDEKKVYAILEDLLGVLPLDKSPKISIYKSRKKRLVKSCRSTLEMNDLYSVCINYYDPVKDSFF